MYDLPFTVLTDAEQILAKECLISDNDAYNNSVVEAVTIAALTFVCERDKFKVDFSDIINRIGFSKASIEKSHKRITDRYTGQDLSKVNRTVSNTCFKILHG